jgi:CheY-like chemotaxis protein
MTPETLARAVEPFYTTKGIGRGSGLGLSMVYGFVEQSGGHLHIESRLGYGTRVDVYLPAARDTKPAAVPATSGIALGAGELVLIVEDEAAVRDIATAFVQSLGYRVHAVASAMAALDYLAANADVALLFSDVMLGSGMNGKELAQTVRQQRPRLPVLLTSGYEDSAMSAADAQEFELLRKPYRREDLALALRRNLLAG